MAKRLTDTDKWKDEWYLSLSNDYKIIWQWLIDNCSHAGICKRTIKLLNIMCETNITEEELIEKMCGRVFICGTNWFIPKFVKFQYTTLKSNKPVVMSVVRELIKTGCYTIIPESFGNDYIIIPESLKDDSLIVKDKDKDKDSIIDNANSIVLNNKKNEILKKEEKEPIYVELKKIYEFSSYETQSDSIKDKYSKNEFDSYLKFIKLFKRYESKIKYNEFPLLDEFVNELFLRFKWNQIEEGITTMFGNGFKTDMHLVSRLITCIGWQKQSSVSNVFTSAGNPIQPKQETEWWKIKYGDRFKTYEEFEEARLAGIIDPFND